MAGIQGIELTQFHPVGQNYPAGVYRLTNVDEGRTFEITVRNTPTNTVAIDVRNPAGTLYRGVATGRLLQGNQQNLILASLEHLQTDNIDGRVPGLGALVVYIFAANVLLTAATIQVATMSPAAAGFYDAVGFPVLATANAYFQQLLQNAGNDQDRINELNQRQNTFLQAFANPNAVQGTLPYTGAPEALPQQIIATNAARMAHWRLVA